MDKGEIRGLYGIQVKNHVNTQTQVFRLHYLYCVCFKLNACSNVRWMLIHLHWIGLAFNCSEQLFKHTLKRRRQVSLIKVSVIIFERECTFPGLRSLAGKADHGIASVLLLLFLSRYNKFMFKFSCFVELCLAEVRLEGAVIVSRLLHWAMSCFGESASSRVPVGVIGSTCDAKIDYCHHIIFFILK